MQGVYDVLCLISLLFTAMHRGCLMLYLDISPIYGNILGCMMLYVVYLSYLRQHTWVYDVLGWISFLFTATCGGCLMFYVGYLSYLQQHAGVFDVLCWISFLFTATCWGV